MDEAVAQHRWGTDLLEREGEGALLEAALDGAAGGRGSTVLIEGPAGIGKSRLLALACELGDRTGARVAHARGIELEREFAFGVVDRLLDGGLAPAADMQRPRGGGAGEPRASLVSPPTGGEPVSGERLHAALDGLYWRCVSAAANSPMLLVVDDAQWADEPSLRWLNFMAARLQGLTVLVVLAARSAEAGVDRELLDKLRESPDVLVAAPAPLSVAAVAALVRELMSTAAEDEFCTACHDATRGNPFLLRALLAAHAAAGGTGDAAAASIVRELGASGVAASVLRRLGSLPAEARELTFALAVLGDGADLTLAAEVAEMDAGATSRAADSLADMDILEPGRPLAFVHPVVRTSIYDALPAATRSDLHARAAELMRVRGAREELAAHLLRCEPRGQAWVAASLAEAATHAVGAGALNSAAVYLRRALAEPPQLSDRAAVLLSLGAVEAAIGAPEASERLESALRVAGTPIERAGVALEVGRSLVLAEQAIDAVKTFLRGLSELGAGSCADDDSLAMRLEAEAFGAAHTSFAARAAAGALIERVMARPLPRGASHAERSLLASIAWEQAATLDASSAGVIAIARKALADPEQLQAETSRWPSMHSGGNALLLCDQLAVARSLFADAMAEASRLHSPRLFAVEASWRAWASLRAGALREAELDARAALDVAAEQGWQILVPCALAVVSECLIARGLLVEARAELERWPQVFEGRDSTQIGPLLASRAHLRALAGDFAGSAEDMTACAAVHSEWINPGFDNWRSAVAVSLARAGRRADAQELVDEELELAQAFGAPLALGVALRAAGFVTGGKAGIELLAQSLAVLEPSEARLELVRTQRSLGIALLHTGDAKSARPPLRQALDGAHRCGASAVAEASRRALIEAGGRPRRPLLSGIDALTPTERYVASLAADGLTNREIAERRFLSLRTVEIHLTNAYRKLEISSRRELRRARLTPLA